MSTEAGSRERELEAEVHELRARIEVLEGELVEVQATTNRVVASWQERAYWLERWHLDLNALMEKPGAAEFRATVRAVRAVMRLIVKARRWLRS